MHRFSAVALVRFSSSVVAAAAVAVAQAPPAAATPPDGMEAIDRVGLLAHAEHLSSDAFGGRLTGTSGQVEAARYIAARFEQLGLEPMGDPREDAGEDGARSYFQHYPIERTSLSGAALRIGEQRYGAGFGVLPSTSMDPVEGEGWVFVSAREPLPELTGKIAVATLRAPKLRTTKIEEVFGASLRTFGRARGLARRAAKAGAVAIVYCIDDDQCIPTAMNYFGLSPGKPLVSFGDDQGMGEMANAWRVSVPQCFLSARLSATLLEALGVEDPVDAAAVGASCAGGLSVAVTVEQDAKAENVVAVLRGSDPELAAEAVVYSAHMDHVGTRYDGEVFNGADDNASGTAGLLEIAEAYTTAANRPRRSILFLAVSGEELGLWGSQWFAENPTWPLPSIVADVNIDMIGRVGPESGADEITVTPSYRHSMFSTIVKDAAVLASHFDLSFTNGDKYYTRSDHFNFAKRGVPVVFFCCGEHEDYHQVTDHADKLDGDKMERVARLAYWIGHQVAQADERPERLGRASGW